MSDPAAADIQSIVDSAKRLGIELDEAATAEWLAAIAIQGSDDVSVDVSSGTFGHRVAMLDFSPRDLARFREIGKIVELTGDPAVSEGALALSGSAAQSKIQSFPGDADFFQRFNIRADTREEACALLAKFFKEKVLAFTRGATYQFLEVKLGSLKSGGPISWHLADIEAGVIQTEDGEVRWEDAALDPGWVKADWVVTDPAHGKLSNASNVIDVTWEAPNGDIVSLDGYLDTFFQEVYLDADQVPTFTKVVAHVSDDALDSYVEQLEGEVRKYLTKHLNYGKAAKRMYNVFRLSGRHMDAAFVREAVRRADHDPVPGVVAHRHPRQRDPTGQQHPDRRCSGAGRRAHSGGREDPRGCRRERDRAGAAAAESHPRIPGDGCGTQRRSRRRAGPGRQPREYLLPRETHGDADDQGIHRRDAGGSRRALRAGSRRASGQVDPALPCCPDAAAVAASVEPRRSGCHVVCTAAVIPSKREAATIRPCCSS